MSDKKLIILSTLKDIKFSINLIEERFKDIKESDDFISSPKGLEKLDAISMRLIAIG